MHERTCIWWTVVHEPSSVAQGWRQFSPSHTTEYCLPAQEAAYWWIAIFIGSVTGRPLGALSPQQARRGPLSHIKKHQVSRPGLVTRSLSVLLQSKLPVFQLHSYAWMHRITRFPISEWALPHNICTTVPAMTHYGNWTVGLYRNEAAVLYPLLTHLLHCLPPCSFSHQLSTPLYGLVV